MLHKSIAFYLLFFELKDLLCIAIYSVLYLQYACFFKVFLLCHKKSSAMSNYLAKGKTGLPVAAKESLKK